MWGMAKKKQAAEESQEQDGALVKTAKAIGETAAKVAAAVGLTKPAKERAPKLEKKKKARLPRKAKKAARKASKEPA